MRRTKNNEISSRADAMVAKRWGVIENDIMSHTPQKIESVEDFLRRGGKITKIKNKSRR